MAGKVKASVAPMTYLNRIRLKARLRRSVDFGIERLRGAGERTRKGSSFLRAAGLMLMLLALAVVVGATALPHWWLLGCRNW